jgi:hypothetical protein
MAAFHPAGWTTLDRAKLLNKSYDINGQAIFKLTRSIAAKPDAAAKLIADHGDAALCDPNEVFVVGSIPILHNVLDRIIVKSDSRGTGVRALVLGYKDQYGIRVFAEGWGEIA